MFNNQVLAGSSGQGGGVTQQSLKFNDDENQYLSWTPAAAGNRKTWTWSSWVKRGNIGGTQMLFTSFDGTNGTELRYISDGGAGGVPESFQLNSFSGGYSQKTLPVHRDPSAWGNLVVSVDTTQATASDRVKIYFNGVQLANDGTTNIPQNYDTHINNNIKHTIGNRAENNTLYFDGYLSDIHFIDGQALDATSFGQFTNGYWKAIDYAGSYGTNGFRLTFQDDVVSEGFNTVTYRGNGSANGQSLSGLGFSPDFVWVKERTTAQNHNLFDSVRGAGNNKGLISDNTSSEGTDSVNYGYISSFDGDGFTLAKGADATFGNARMNDTGAAYVAWCWDAGTGSAASNTDGSITSTVKANPDYGFSIGTFTKGSGTETVGHGLSVAPDWLLVKRYSGGTGSWGVYHSGNTANPETDYLRLNSTNGTADDATFWGDTAPTSTVFSIGSAFNSGEQLLFYAWTDISGYSKFGSYSGTGSSGNAVTTGFAPAWLMIKNTDAASSWAIFDNTRNPSPPQTQMLRANVSNAEETKTDREPTFTSTGFIIGDADVDTNASGNDYIYMAFADTREAAFWKDVSGQGNHWTPNNLDYRDSLLDSPANNFAVMNPLNTATSTLSEGNLKVLTQASGYSPCVATFGQRSGKWYWEHFVQDTSTADFIGVVDDTWDVESGNYVGGLLGSSGVDSISYYADGSKYINGTGTSYGASYTTADFIGVALNLDDDEITFYKNGVSQGVISYTFSGNDILAANGEGTGTSNTATFIVNFGQDSTFAGATTAGGNTDANGIGDFKYPVPAGGYLALCSVNLPEPTIVDGSEHFNTVLYVGDGAASKSITSVNFEPNFTWIKVRNNPNNHRLFDSVRGASSDLVSNSTGAESITTTRLLSFDTDGFTVGSNAEVNGSGYNHVAWNWKAGGTAVSNTDGSITSQVSANVDAGFSIVSYTGTGSAATVGHGLSSAPEMVITKARNDTTYWIVNHKDLTSGTSNLYLQSTATQQADGNWTAVPTSSVLNLGVASVNQTSDNYISYCFHSVDGFSKVGSYTGNGSSDGTFVYTGFRPAWVMVKTSSLAGQYWNIFDNVRDPFNDQNTQSLYPNVSDAEGTGNVDIDFLSNGMKMRDSGNNHNSSGQTYIYLAFAETPLKFATAR